MAEREEVEAFLNEIKRNIRSGNWAFIKRQKNLQGLIELDFTPRQAKLEVLRLSYRHYDRGPLQDNEGRGEIWEFIKPIRGSNVYIKLKLDHRGCVCLSFHLSQGPTTLPFAK